MIMVTLFLSATEQVDLGFPEACGGLVGQTVGVLVILRVFHPSSIRRPF
jgi:hypothetical protein